MWGSTCVREVSVMDKIRDLCHDLDLYLDSANDEFYITDEVCETMKNDLRTFLMRAYRLGKKD